MPTGIQKIEAVIRDMRGDHNVAASILDEIRVVTSNYTYAYNQSNCLDTLYRKLKSFDSRFRLDIHVENNILFPKAALLERELVKLKLL